MEKSKRLIPYSVHLREDIYKKLKAAAGDRKASGMVRDAITMIIEGDDTYTSGYIKGLQTAIELIESDSYATHVMVNKHNIGTSLVNNLNKLITKKKPNGTKKG